MTFLRPRSVGPRSAIQVGRLLPLLFVFLILACMEITPPVQERLSLAFDPAGGVEVALDVSIADPAERFSEEAAARKRIADARWLYENGKDEWASRFAAVDWTQETFSYRKERGGLASVRRTGSLKDAAGLSAFLAGTSVTASTSKGDGFMELSLSPGTPLRATRDQRVKMERLLEAWIPAVRTYHAELAALYAYLDRHPDRARACFGEMFSDRLDAVVKEALPPLTEEEKGLLDTLGDAMGKVADVLLFTRDEAYSPDELSRLVYDPFPAPLQIALPGEVLEAEGFESAGPQGVAYSGTSLWKALSRLEEKAVTPDPLMLALPAGHLPDSMTGGAKAQGPPLDLEALAVAPRRVQPWGSEEELRSAITAALAPAPVYRVRWRTPAAAAPPATPAAEDRP